MTHTDQKPDLATGGQVGSWTLLERKTVPKRSMWLCKCRCGVDRWVLSDSLRSGKSRGCGCEMGLRGGAARTVHGNATKRAGRSKEYIAWAAMRDRCLSPTHDSYKNYGARGIGICDRWSSFENFLADMGPAPSRNLTLERVDNNGNYEPANCKWATRREQNHNKRGSGIRNGRGQFVGMRGIPDAT